jgi:Na+/H+ antiporter NhaD/arsenite permease-like protein
MLPPALLAFAATAAVLLLVYRRETATPFQDPPSETAIPAARTAAYGLAALVLVAAALTASGPLGMPLHVVALAAGAVLLFAVPLVGADTSRATLRRIDWNVLLLFIGLFLLLGGVRDDPAFQDLLATLPPDYDSATGLATLALVTAILSTLVSNVPAVLLIGEGLPPDATAFYVLAAASTLAGNATMVGAAANLLVAERAAELGEHIPLRRFLAAGVPASILSLVVAVAWLTIVR